MVIKELVSFASRVDDVAFNFSCCSSFKSEMLKFLPRSCFSFTVAGGNAYTTSAKEVTEALIDIYGMYMELLQMKVENSREG